METGIAWHEGTIAAKRDCRQLVVMLAPSRIYPTDNRVDDLTPLLGLDNLIYLYAENNGLSDISALSGMTDLIRLELTANNVRDISVVSDFIHLNVLLLSQNSIIDITPLAENQGMDSVTRVDITHNPINCSDPVTQTNLASLEERWVILSHDCY